MIQPAVLNPATSSPPGTPTLRRELGRWDLTAIGVNQVIGGAVFALPAALFASAGAWSPWLVAAVAFASLLIALSFAEVSSRFEGTGGPYLYTRAAFGRFPAFQVGWLLWFTRAASWASVISVLATSLGFYFPAVTAGTPRAILIAIIIAIVAAINIRGIKQSSFIVNVFTIGKLMPLVLFITLGFFYMNPGALALGPLPEFAGLSASALLLIFAFGGYETVPVPAGEAKDPRTAVPFALVMTIVIVALITILIQVVAVGTLPSLAASRTPLADAAALFIGAAGAGLMTIGAVISTTGNNMGQALSGSRNLYALAEQGDLPAFFGRVHPSFRTPYTAILVTAAVALALALSGTFAVLATASAISRLVVYVATCASTIRLRAPQFAGTVRPATFVVPGGPIIPLLAIGISLTIIAGASRAQLIGGAWAIAAGTVLYIVATRRSQQEVVHP
jgi:basic amino acid/polyamine antiporter, APA family